MNILFRLLKLIILPRCWLLLTVIMSAQVAAENLDIQILGLFKNKIIAVVDGRQKVLQVGDTTAHGFTLIEANSKGAIFERAGKQEKINLSTQISNTYQSSNVGRDPADGGDNANNNKQSAAKIVRIKLDKDGRYLTGIKINGIAADALIDTGANIVSLSSTLAKKLQLDY